MGKLLYLGIFLTYSLIANNNYCQGATNDSAAEDYVEVKPILAPVVQQLRSPTEVVQSLDERGRKLTILIEASQKNKEKEKMTLEEIQRVEQGKVASLLGSQALLDKSKDEFEGKAEEQKRLLQSFQSRREKLDREMEELAQVQAE